MFNLAAFAVDFLTTATVKNPVNNTTTLYPTPRMDVM